MIHICCSCSRVQDLYGTPTWTNFTENAGGQIAGFVDFDWSANLCPGNDCGEQVLVRILWRSL